MSVTHKYQCDGCGKVHEVPQHEFPPLLPLSWFVIGCSAGSSNVRAEAHACSIECIPKASVLTARDAQKLVSIQ